MKKYILFALMSIISITSYSQVYLSKIYNDIMILGPNNVAPHCDEIARSYAAEIEGLYDVLIKEQESLKANISLHNKVVAPTKAQSFVASEQLGDLNQIEKEMTIIMQLKEQWLKIIDQTPVKLELVDAIRAGQCIELKTNHGTYYDNDYMVTLDKNITNIKIIEHFSIERKDSIPQWVTKVDENCASNDPEDCKVWCFLNQPGGDVIVDFTGDIYRIKDSKIGAQFDLIPSTSSAQRILTLDLQGSTIDIINVVKSENNMLLQLDGFSTIECQE